MMHEPNDSVPDNIRAFLDKLSGDELIAVQRYLMKERGIDPYAYLDAGDDDLDDADRAELHKVLDCSLAQADAGQLIPSEDVMAELRRRR